MSEIVYSRSNHGLIKGRAYENPRFFSGVRPGITKVIVIGNHPEIVEAYKAAGIPVEQPDEDKKAKALAASIARGAAPPPEQLYIPSDWRDLPWTQKAGEDGLSLRGLASALTDEPVSNKEAAVAVIETEMARRGSPQEPKV
jgi:hypothetical protein